MLIFNCTKATEEFFTVTQGGEKQTIIETPASKEMDENVALLQYKDGSPAQPFQWVLHTVSIRQRNCLVALEVNTCFCVIVAGLEKADSESFLDSFRAFLSIQVLDYGIENQVWQQADTKNFIANTVEHFAEFRFFQRMDHKLHKLMNEIVRHFQERARYGAELLDDSELLVDFCRVVNRTPREHQTLSDQKSIVPIREMLLYWQQQYCGISSEQALVTRQKLAMHADKKIEGIIEKLGNTSPVVMESAYPEPEDISYVLVPGNELPDSDELDFIDEVLFKYEAESSLADASVLHGFLTAIASGPNKCSPSEWLDKIWGGDADQPEWESGAEMEGFMNIVFNMMNNITQKLTDNAQNFTAVMKCNDRQIFSSDWCCGYIDGVMLDEQVWSAMPNHMLAQVDLIDTVAGAMLKEGVLSSLETHARADAVILAALKLHAYWSRKQGGSPRMLPDVPMSVSQQPVFSHKTGRNDPCPCGSGKKFKKCCLH